VRSLQEADLPEAKRIFHLAFGTFLGLPDPMQFWPDRDYVRTRYAAYPTGALAAEVNGEVIASNFAANWGSVGFFGPLDLQDFVTTALCRFRPEWQQQKTMTGASRHGF
jgi:hypothetical protein